MQKGLIAFANVARIRCPVMAARFYEEESLLWLARSNRPRHRRRRRKGQVLFFLPSDSFALASTQYIFSESFFAALLRSAEFPIKQLWL